ncbi:MAG TPA: nuclear transport factor 2 family protein [Candidatus Binatia bacterium]|nr:nuclear transport factor 2 family protein [Candidatus Binatia bacterium]
MSEVEEKLRSAYRAWHDSKASDPSAWMALFGDDIVVKSVGDGVPGIEFSMPRRGREEATRYFADIARDWEMSFIEADEFVCDGDRVVVLGRCGWKHRGTGKDAKSPFAHFWRFRGGKAAEFREFFDTACALAAAQPG